jgi:hypothetical protein
LCIGAEKEVSFFSSFTFFIFEITHYTSRLCLSFKSKMIENLAVDMQDFESLCFAKVA